MESLDELAQLLDRAAAYCDKGLIIEEALRRQGKAGTLVLSTKRERPMAASSKLMIIEAERRFPCRIKLSVPIGGFGTGITEMQEWLDENCGADGWAMTPAGLRVVLNDAVAIYFLDATSAVAFVARWCAGISSGNERRIVPGAR